MYIFTADETYNSIHYEAPVYMYTDVKNIYLNKIVLFLLTWLEY